jgi:hypothetical protein
MDIASWVSVSGLVVLGFSPVVWLIRSELQERRKARFAAEMAAYHRKIRPALPATEPKLEDDSPRQPNKQITLAELVERIEREGFYGRPSRN